jgi:hypothetical protein
MNLKQLDHLPVKAEEEKICQKKETIQTHCTRLLGDSEENHALLLNMPPRIHFFALCTVETRIKSFDLTLRRSLDRSKNHAC